MRRGDPAFDPLGQRNFFGGRQQVDPPDLLEVHPYGIRRSTSAVATRPLGLDALASRCHTGHDIVLFGLRRRRWGIIERIGFLIEEHSSRCQLRTDQDDDICGEFD